MKTAGITLLIALVGASLSIANAQTSPDKSVVAAASVPAVASVAQFEKIKLLAGEWEAPYDGKIMRDIFRVIGNGTAVLHTESWDGITDGAVTVIYPVGNELRADHYCDLENQPRYVATYSEDPNIISFKLKEVTNLSSPQAEYFHGVTWRFIDANHHIQDWEWFKDGKQKEMLRMEFTRTK